MAQAASEAEQTARDRLVERAIAIVFYAVLFAWGVVLMRSARNAYFVGDDWGLLHQAGSWGGMVDPYNDHLSVTILAIYRALVELVGFSYWPFRLAGVACFVAIPLALFTTTRQVIGSPLAAVASLSLLGVRGMELNPAVLNHYLVLVAGIGCAAALNRGPRADWFVTCSLALALSAAGGGVAVAVGAAVHSACTRAAPRRWLAVAVPSFGWAGWWVLMARDDGSSFSPTVRPTLTEALRYSLDVVSAPFEYAGLGSTILAAALGAAFLIHGVSLARKGVSGAANFVGWTAALAVWAIGLAYGRGAQVIGGEAQDVLFRYRLLALGFALLALVPTRRVSWSRNQSLRSGRRWLGLLAATFLIAALARALADRDDFDARAARFESYGRHAQAELLVLGLGPDVIVDHARMDALFFGLDAGDIRAVVDRYGPPLSSTPSAIDQQLIGLKIVSVQIRPRGQLPCRPLPPVTSWSPAPGRPLVMSSDRRWNLDIRRFGSEWITITELEAGQRVVLALPRLGTDRPWQVRTEGTCRIRG